MVKIIRDILPGRIYPLNCNSSKRPLYPHRAVVKRRATVRRAGIGTNEAVDADAAFESGIGPDRFEDDDAALYAVECFRMHDYGVACIAELYAIACSNAELGAIVRMN